VSGFWTVEMRRGFTLLEVLIAVILMGLIIPALFKATELLRRSNVQMQDHLKEVEKENRAYKVFFKDFAASDGNITLHRDDFDAICALKTEHSLYNLVQPSVCWVVLRQSHMLVRIEGEGLRYPLNQTSRQENFYADALFPVSAFRVEYRKSNLFVFIEKKNKAPVTFVIQGVYKPFEKKQPAKKRRKKAKPAVPSSPKVPASAT